MEVFDLAAVDILLWVAKTKWWDIPGTEDLQQLWHDPTKKIQARKIPVPVEIYSRICLLKK